MINRVQLLIHRVRHRLRYWWWCQLWQYGTVNGEPVRRHLFYRGVQSLIWPKGHVFPDGHVLGYDYWALTAQPPTGRFIPSTP